MSLREKIGQMLAVGFEGTEPSASIAELISKYKIGGVIYFARNVRDVGQVAQLSASLQEEAIRAGTEPLFIALDQEGGMVARITEGIALMPGQMAIAAGSPPEAAYEAGHISGQELRALGINLNLAPVLDVNNNPQNPVIGVRSFGESPQRVAAYGEQVIRGLQDANVAATAKHFPGHGDTAVDSHSDLPVVAHTRERIEQVELVPFRRAIEAGVDAIMTAHIYFPAYEAEKLPATLSPAILTGLLRKELGFDGVIMTDSMTMQAIYKHYGSVNGAVMAVEAGADLIVFSSSHELTKASIEAIAEAVEQGRIPESRIDESVARLLALKKKRGLYESSAALPLLHKEQFSEAARRLSEKSMTLLRDDMLPLADAPTLVIMVTQAVVSLVDDQYTMPVTLGGALRKAGLRTVTELIVPFAKAEDYADEAAQQAAAYEQVVIGTYNAHLSPGQAQLVKAVRRAVRKLTVVALRNPYDYSVCRAADAFLCTYESRPLALQSAARVLLGQIAAEGKLPVTLSD